MKLGIANVLFLEEAANWVLESTEFCSWYDGADTRPLWIRGDPGKGKTMMAIALIGYLVDFGLILVQECCHTSSVKTPT